MVSSRIAFEELVKNTPICHHLPHLQGVTWRGLAGCLPLPCTSKGPLDVYLAADRSGGSA